MASALGPKKELGQHWLRDPEILAEIAEAAELGKSDVVLEIGPGLGTLTSRLLARAQRVVAVEFDGDLARKLPGQFPGKNADGSMLIGWQNIGGNWYYLTVTANIQSWFFNSDTRRWEYRTDVKHPYGSLFINEATPDGYNVNSDGVWN